jgi:hypothetical protein
VTHKPLFSITTMRHKQSRSGLMVFAALVCLLVILSIALTMLQGALRARRQMLAERDRRQCELLLEAGANRVAARLAAEPDFRGDTWELPAESIAGQARGRVTTQITPGATGQGWSMQVSAEYPLDRPINVRRSQRFDIASTMTP